MTRRALRAEVRVGLALADTRAATAVAARVTVLLAFHSFEPVSGLYESRVHGCPEVGWLVTAIGGGIFGCRESSQSCAVTDCDCWEPGQQHKTGSSIYKNAELVPVQFYGKRKKSCHLPTPHHFLVP